MGLAPLHSVISRFAPFGVYEGAFASRNPVCTLPPGTAVGATDIAVGRFAWADPASFEVSNVRMANGLLGLAQPRAGLWSLTYWRRGVRYLRAGKPVTLYAAGEFYVRFPLGTLIGNPVYCDPATGIAYGSNLGGYILTSWVAVTNVRPGALGVISPYQYIG